MPLYQLPCVDPEHLSRGPAGSNEADWAEKTATWVEVPAGQSPTPQQLAMAGKCRACARLHPITPAPDRGPMEGPRGTIPAGLVLTGVTVYLAGLTAGTTSIGSADRIRARGDSRHRLLVTPHGAVPSGETLTVRIYGSQTPGGAYSPINASAVQLVQADGTLSEPKKGPIVTVPQGGRWLVVGFTYSGAVALAIPVSTELQRVN